MQKLTTVHTMNEAEAITGLLKSRGITNFIGNRDPDAEVVVNMFDRPPMIEIWVIMDEQYADAMELLQNPEHEVAEPLTEREIELLDDIESQAYSPATISLIKFSVMIFFGTIVLCIIAYWLRT